MLIRIVYTRGVRHDDIDINGIPELTVVNRELQSIKCLARKGSQKHP